MSKDDLDDLRKIAEEMMHGEPLTVVFDKSVDENLTIGFIQTKFYAIIEQHMKDKLTFMVDKAGLNYEGEQVIEHWRFGYEILPGGKGLYSGGIESETIYDNTNWDHIKLLMDDGGVKIIFPQSKDEQ